MRKVRELLCTYGVVCILAWPAAAQVQKTLPTHTVNISGTVETIDHAKRVVTIKTSDGKFVTIDVPAGAARFNELKVGDKVSASYNNTVSARLKAPGEAPVDTAAGATTAGQQAQPGGTAVTFCALCAGQV